MLEQLKRKSKKLKRETFTLYLIYKESPLAKWKKIFLVLIIGYAVSPIDLIPDFIPILGYLDDLLIVPLGIYIALKLIPKEIKDEYQEKVKGISDHSINLGKKTELIIILIWIIGFLVILGWSIEVVLLLIKNFHSFN